MKNSLLSVDDMTRDDVLSIVRRARELASGRSIPEGLYDCAGVLLFTQPSTRTKASFYRAMRYLNMDVLILDDSSLDKNETLESTLEALNILEYNVAVVRDQNLEEFHLTLPVINAGCRLEHPTQALVDVATLSTKFKTFDGLKINFRGDVERSRVTRSTGSLFKLLGAEVVYNESLEECDVVYQIRQQVEQGRLMDDESYKSACGLLQSDLSSAPKVQAVMHAGPVMIGIDMDEEALRGPLSLVDTQVKLGLFTRMALLEKMVENGSRHGFYTGSS